MILKYYLWEVFHYLTNVSGHFFPLGMTVFYGIIINKGIY